MTNKLNSLNELILRDIAISKYPGDKNIAAVSSAILDDEKYSLDDFIGKKWDELDNEFLVNHHNAIFYMTNAAFFYYLPAYLLSAINNSEISLVDDALSIALLPKSENSVKMFHENMALLDRRQKRVLRTCIDFLKLNKDGVFGDNYITEQIRIYWDSFEPIKL